MLWLCVFSFENGAWGSRDFSGSFRVEVFLLVLLFERGWGLKTLGLCFCISWAFGVARFLIRGLRDVRGTGRVVNTSC